MRAHLLKAFRAYRCAALCCIVLQYVRRVSVLQRVAVYCSVLRYVAGCCGVLQCCIVLQYVRRVSVYAHYFKGLAFLYSKEDALHPATYCNTLQCTATRCNTLRHTATHCTTLHHTATHCNTLQPTTTHYNTLQHTVTHCNTL